MREDNKSSVPEWFVKGDHDIDSAQYLFDHKKHTDIIAILIHHGWKLKKTHDLQELVIEVSKIDKTFEIFEDPCINISKYYLDARYPGFPGDYSREEIKKSLEVAKKIIKKIKEAIK
jgi:HEPN domain-containing protein